MKPDRQRPVSLEDLLRLKRAERPAAEFWVQFDRELRAKQLAALVQQRPWWQRLAVRPAFTGFARWSLPLGATAALTLSFVALRDSAPPAPTSPSPAVASSAALAPAPATAATQLPAPRDSAPVDTFAAASTPATPDVAEATPSAVIAATLPIESAAPLPATFLQLGSAADSPADVSPSARVIAANLAATADIAAPALVGTLLGGVRAFEPRTAATRSAVDPLHQMASPGERTRARLLTAMVSMASADDSSRTAERVARRIEEERLYDQISRVGARGDRVNWKF